MTGKWLGEEFVGCPHCFEWYEHPRGCWLCDDKLFVPTDLAVEFKLMEIPLDFAWGTAVRALRRRHGLDSTAQYPSRRIGPGDK